MTTKEATNLESIANELDKSDSNQGIQQMADRIKSGEDILKEEGGSKDIEKAAIPTDEITKSGLLKKLGDHSVSGNSQDVNVWKQHNSKSMG